MSPYSVGWGPDWWAERASQMGGNLEGQSPLVAEALGQPVQLSGRILSICRSCGAWKVRKVSRWSGQRDYSLAQA